MKLQDFLKQFEGLNPDTEILIGCPSDYSFHLNSTMEIDTNCINMSDDFTNNACRKVLFLA